MAAANTPSNPAPPANTPAAIPAGHPGLPGPAQVEASLLPYVDAAYGLARWLVGDELLAEDLVLHACQLALQQPAAPQDGQARPWLLAIVHRTAHDWLARNRQQPSPDEGSPAPASPARTDTAELADMLRQLKPGRAQLNAALAHLDLPLREALVLQEIEALPPEQIAQVMALPTAQVLALLAHARRQLILYLRDGDRQPQHERR